MLLSIITTLMLTGIIFQSSFMSTRAILSAIILPAQQKSVYNFLQRVRYESIYHNRKAECFLNQPHKLCCRDTCYSLFAPLTFALKGNIGFKENGRAIRSGTLYLKANKSEKKIAVDTITGIMRIR